MRTPKNSSIYWKQYQQGSQDFENEFHVAIVRFNCDNSGAPWVVMRERSLFWRKISFTNASPNADRSQCLWSVSNLTKSTTEILTISSGSHSLSSIRQFLMRGVTACQNNHQYVHCCDVDHTTRANYAFHLLRVNMGIKLNTVNTDYVHDMLHANVGNLELNRRNRVSHKH